MMHTAGATGSPWSAMDAADAATNRLRADVATAIITLAARFNAPAVLLVVVAIAKARHHVLLFPDAQGFISSLQMTRASSVD